MGRIDYCHTILQLGTNLGDRKSNLEKAHALIKNEVGNITASSSIYETDAWGNQNQEAFLNQVIKVKTTKSPIDLLSTIKNIESTIGRVPKEKWSARIIDIDILYFEKLQLNTEELTIPHPFIRERRFVLAPLNELIPEFIHPGTDQNISQLLESCADTLNVKRCA